MYFRRKPPLKNVAAKQHFFSLKGVKFSYTVRYRTSLAQMYWLQSVTTSSPVILPDEGTDSRYESYAKENPGARRLGLIRELYKFLA